MQKRQISQPRGFLASVWLAGAMGCFAISSMAWAQGPATRPAPSVTTTVAADGDGPVGVLMLPNLEATVQRGLDWMEFFEAEPIKNNQVNRQFLALIAKRFFPQVQAVKLHRFFQLIPAMLRPLGIDVSKPLGVIAWKLQRPQPVAMPFLPPQMQWMQHTQIAPVFTLAVNPALLFVSLQVLGLSPKQFQKDGVSYWTVGTAGNGSALGIVRGNRLYFLLRNVLPFGGIRAESKLRTLLVKVAAQASPLAYAVKESGATALWKKAQAKSWDAFVAMGSKRIGFLAQLKQIQNRFRSVGMGLSVENGLRFEIFVDVGDKVAPFLELLTPTPHAVDMLAQTPAFLGWFGQSHLRFSNFFDTVSNPATPLPIPSFFAMMLRVRWNQIHSQLLSQGVDLPAIAKMLNGQFASGLLWTRELSRSLGQFGKPNFSGKLHNAFVMFGLQKQEDGPRLLASLLGMWNKATQNKRTWVQGTKVEAGKFHGVDAIKVTLPKIQPIFLAVHQRLLLIAGDDATLSHFAAVWGGKALSLKAAMQRDPRLAKAFPHTEGSFMSLHPLLISDLSQFKQLFATAPPPAQRFLRLLASRFQRASLSSHYNKNSVLMSSGLSFSPKPMPPYFLPNRPSISTPVAQGPDMTPFAMGLSIFSLPFLNPIYTGLIAAVAVPAYLRFLRRSKTSEALVNLKALGNGAILWFDAEHADKNGDPINKHFPGKDPQVAPTQRQVHVNPPTKPCADGKMMYPRNPAIWNKQPWISLRFALRRAHYYQYTYITWGNGLNSKFILRAQGDLNCDGKLSSYEIRGHVNPKTGEVGRSNVIVRNGLE